MNSRLKRIHAFGYLSIIVLKIFNMVITHITSHLEFMKNRKKQSFAIKEASGKFIIHSQIMSTETHNGIYILIAETHSSIDFTGIATIEHHLNPCGRIQIDKSDSAHGRIVAPVEQSNLPSAGMSCTNIKQTYLQTLQAVSEVGRCNLNT